VKRGTAAKRRQPAERRRPPAPGALLTLLARGLGLSRAALLVESAPGGDLEPIALHGVRRLASLAPGGAPDAGPWSAALPVATAERTIGLLLVDAGAGAPLTVVDAHLAEAAAAIAARLVEQGRAAADLERAQAMLGQADRLAHLGMLAAGIAHEIRNPLVSVRTFIQLLPERLADEEFRTGFRDLALREIERICGLLTDLLAFSRPAPPEREPTDVNELVGQTVRILDPEARRRNVALAVTVDDAVPHVVADEAQVKQVLMNLVLNAIEACDSGGRVDIATRHELGGDGRWVTVAVADSGGGIAPEVAERVFDPFFTTKETGNGLGLFIARQIVDGHAGRIAVDSVPREGTTFTVRFPVALEPRQAGADAR
jgi:signal transduction histidine kinase